MPEAPSAVRRRILLVEDDPDARMALASLLERRASAEIRSAGTGSEALELAADWTPDVVLLDLTLPDLDGFEVIESLRGMEALRDTLFIALTGRTEPEVVALTKKAGFDHLVAKPVQDIAALARLVAHEG